MLRRVTAVVVAVILGEWAQAQSLKEVVRDVLESNPIVLERLKNYTATRHEVDIAASGYYPTVDIEVGTGRKYTNRIRSNNPEDDYDVYYNILVLRQNLFNGFGTQEQVRYQQMRTLAAAYSYLEKANDVTLQTVTAYIDLFRQKELLENSKRDVAQKEAIYKKVLKVYKAGLTTLSEVSKIKSVLSLARANMVVQKNRFESAIYNYKKLVGRYDDLAELDPPTFEATLPGDPTSAMLYALEYNPSLLVGRYNIKGAEALYKESKSRFYPKLDLELSANYTGYFSDVDVEDDYLQGMLILSYNLYRGGADEALRKSRLSKLHQEVEVTHELQRRVAQGLELSWSAYRLIKERIPFLKQYRKQSAKTLKLYSKEYDMGQRSLLDLLAAQSDLKQADDELINSKYDLILSQYRIMDAMGLTMAAVLGNVEEYYQKVGLVRGKREERNDTLPVVMDKDRDTVSPTKDPCPHSKTAKDLLPYGCYSDQLQGGVR